MIARPAFNPAEPFDAVANLAKREVAHAGVLITQRPEYKAAEADDVDVGEAVMAGALTAVCGIVMSHFKESDEAHAAILAAMADYLPQAIDQARSILGLPPLPEAK
ncbi:hypothetical protein [Mesorhizobium sp. CAU 1741]|uniref:hypothetical protein n=1 Tax=Mesorhizobium sp. CAU 1741 TaxID=3140366 RepID=UPI00325C03EC